MLFLNHFLKKSLLFGGLAHLLVITVGRAESPAVDRAQSQQWAGLSQQWAGSAPKSGLGSVPIVGMA